METEETRRVIRLVDYEIPGGRSGVQEESKEVWEEEDGKDREGDLETAEYSLEKGN